MILYRFTIYALSIATIDDAGTPMTWRKLRFIIGVGAHGYSVVRARSETLEVEFVCIPRPLERTESKEGGPLAYRITHRVKRWTPRTSPQLERTRVEGNLPLVA